MTAHGVGNEIEIPSPFEERRRVAEVWQEISCCHADLGLSSFHSVHRGQSVLSP